MYTYLKSKKGNREKKRMAKKRGNPNLGKAQRKCKGKKGATYKACVKRASRGSKKKK